MGSFRTFQTAVSGLSAAQTSLAVVSHNMSNVHNTGYTRQSVIQTDSTYNKIGANYSGPLQIGLGTNISVIRQIRDKFLDKTYRTSASSLGYYNVAYNVGTGIENILGEMEGEYKLSNVLKDLRNSINELANNPQGVDTRGEFISSCITFIDKANDIYYNLRSYQEELNGNIMSMTKRVNELVAEINDYNKLIKNNEYNGNNANDFRDSRNNALDELSYYLNMEYTIKADGTVDIFSEGTALLSNGVQMSLGFRYCSSDDNFVEIVVTSRPDILKYSEDAKLFFSYDRDVTAPTESGALKGMVVARGTSSVNYTSSLDQIAARYDEDKVALLDKYGGDDTDVDYLKEKALLDLQYKRDKWNINNCSIPQSQLKIDTLFNAIVTLLNDSVAPTQVKGTDIYGNEILEQNVNSPYGSDGSQIFMQIFTRKGSSYKYDEETGELRGVDTNDPYSLYTIGNVTINPALRNASNYKHLALSDSGDESDPNLLLRILNAWDGEFVGIDKKTKVSVETYYNRMVSDLGTDNNKYKMLSESENDILTECDNKRLSISGVSLDEEMTFMLQYQYAYNASARLINYIDSMLDKIINGTGRVGL